MKEIFSQVIEKEKDADSKIEKAKEDASAMLMGVDAENREKIKHYREMLQTRSNEDIQAFLQQVKAREAESLKEAEAKMTAELKQKNETVTRCAGKVFEILIGKQTE